MWVDSIVSVAQKIGSQFLHLFLVSELLGLFLNLSVEVVGKMSEHDRYYLYKTNLGPEFKH